MKRSAFEPPYSQHANRAFTIVELLSVLLIVGILCALLLPTLAGSKERAGRANCIGNFKQIALALQSYADDHGDGLPGPIWLGLYERFDNRDSSRLAFYLANHLGLQSPNDKPQDAPPLRCPSAAKNWKQPDASTPLMSSYVPLSYKVPEAVTNPSSSIVSRPFGYPYSLMPNSALTDEPPKRLHEIANPAASWAMVDVDKLNSTNAADYYEFLPDHQVHGKVRDRLFFDWHAASLK
jgi:type II secretory pathway pseudopilin PulG